MTRVPRSVSANLTSRLGAIQSQATTVGHSQAGAMEKGKKPAWRRKRNALCIIGASVAPIALLFVLCRETIGKAFSDRGQSRSAAPIIHTRDPVFDPKAYSEQFSCKSPARVVNLSDNIIGMYPFLLSNHKGVCNRSIDFVGYGCFLDAVLYGEASVGQPCTSEKAQSARNPGLYALKQMVKERRHPDHSAEFHWWLFPVPMAMPDRGFSYALFQGDFYNLVRHARNERNTDYLDVFLEGLDVFLALQGWNLHLSRPNKEKVKVYEARDHVVTKAWISLICIVDYAKDPMADSLITVKQRTQLTLGQQSLETFMTTKQIRYPVGFLCVSDARVGNL